MSTPKKLLDADGLEHLIALIKGADASLREELMQAIQEAGPSLTADGVTIEDDGGTLSVKDGGIGTVQLADASVTKDKLAPGAIDSSSIESGSVTADKLAEDLVVPVAKGGTGATDAAGALTNLGAAAADHTHDASDITSGTLPVARGGTGVTTDDALYQKVVTSHYPDNDELLAYLGLS